jgi:hypothetical protein
MKSGDEKRNYRKQSTLRFAKPEKRVPVASQRVGVASRRVGVASKEVAVASRQVPIGTNVARVPCLCGAGVSPTRAANVSSAHKDVVHAGSLGNNKDADKMSASHAGGTPATQEAQELDLRAMVFHVRPHEELEVRRTLKRFGGPRRRRGAALAAALRALNIQMRKRK